MTAQSAQWMPASDSDYEQLKGMDVFSRDGDRLGTIHEIIHPNHNIAPGEGGHFFRFDPGTLKSWFGDLDEAYLPESTIYAVNDQGVYIDLSESQIRDRRWDMPANMADYFTT